LISTFADFSIKGDATSDFEDDEDDEEDEGENIFEVAEFFNDAYSGEQTRHPYIRNYNKIINSLNYIKPEIMKVILLSTGETVAILKTCWIRIFQRTWRRKFAKRIAFFKNIHTILLRRLNGRVYYK
jgi:hypothetical protein